MSKPSAIPGLFDLGNLALRSTSRFAPLSDIEVNCVREIAKSAGRVPAGTLLLSENRASRLAIMVLAGWACRQRLVAGGRRQIFEFILPGDVIGLSAFPDACEQTAAVALTPVVVARTSAFQSALEQNADAYPGFATFARAMLERESRRLLDQIARIGKLTAEERLVDLILELHRRLREVGLADTTGFPMAVTQEVLADALGLSLVHVNRTLASLRRAGLLQLRDSFVTMTEFDRDASENGASGVAAYATAANENRTHA